MGTRLRAATVAKEREPKARAHTLVCVCVCVCVYSNVPAGCFVSSPSGGTARPFFRSKRPLYCFQVGLLTFKLLQEASVLPFLAFKMLQEASVLLFLGFETPQEAIPLALGTLLGRPNLEKTWKNLCFFKVF